MKQIRKQWHYCPKCCWQIDTTHAGIPNQCYNGCKESLRFIETYTDDPKFFDIVIEKPDTIKILRTFLTDRNETFEDYLTKVWDDLKKKEKYPLV